MAEHPNQVLIRRGFKAFNEGDIETLTEVLADDVVQVMPGHNLFSGEYKGRDAVLTMYGRLFEETGGTFSADLENVYAVDGTPVALYQGTAQRQGKQLDQRYALIFEIVDGKAVRLIDLPEDQAAEDEFLA